MIIVLIGARTAPYVAEVTPEQLILLANDVNGPVSHTSSLPPGVYPSDWEKAWAILSKDMAHARRFQNQELAEYFYARTRHNLPVSQTVKVLELLSKLKGTT
jgi:hypothetical protein